MDASKTAALRPLRILLITLTLHIVLLWQPVAAQDAGLSESGLAIANAINQVRVENGLQPLAVHPLLNQAAQGHVNDMLTNYIYGHYGSDGSSVHVRVARTGYSDSPWVSENWVSSGSPAGAMRWWMNDYIHKVNILTPRWREVGIGVGTRGSEMIFVTVFSAGEGAVGEAVNLDVPAQPPSVRIDQEKVPAGGLDYTVRPGDTLLAIGLRYGMPWEDVAAANGLNETSLLQIGQILRIPGSGEAAAAAAPVPDVPTEPYTVKSGETLFSIAAQRGMSWQDLAAINQMGEHSILQINQEIKVPAPETEEEEAPEVEAARLASAEDGAEDEGTGESQAETLAAAAPVEEVDEVAMALAAVPITAPGTPDAVSEVAASNMAAPEAAPEVASVAMAESAEASAPSVETVSEPVAAKVAATVAVSAPEQGAPAATEADEVALASVAAVPAEAAVGLATGIGGPVDPGAAVGAVLYTIAEGDTLFSIAVAQGLDWQVLMDLNDMSEYSILQPGQQIRLR